MHLRKIVKEIFQDPLGLLDVLTLENELKWEVKTCLAVVRCFDYVLQGLRWVIAHQPHD